MQAYRILTPLSISLLALVLGSCGSAPVKQESLVSVGVEQVQQMSDYDQLLALYQKSAAALQGKDSTAYASDFASLAGISKRLVDVKQTDLKALFETSRLASGEVPLSVLRPLSEEAGQAPLPENLWAPVTALVNAEKEKTETSMKARVDQLETESLEDSERLLVMDDLYRVSGNKIWLDRRNEFVDSIVEEIRQAKRDGTISTALQPKIDLVRENRADDKALIEELVAVSAEIYKQDYFNALSEGEADKAYDVFVRMSKSKDFDAIKQSLSDSSQKMVDYFVAEADESVKDPANVAQSYRWYSQAKVVTKELGLKSSAKEGQKLLVEQLYAKFKEYQEAETPTIGFAYLHFIKEFSPLHKGLRQHLTEEREKVQSLAVKRLSTTQFEGGGNGYGDVISSKVTQHLFKHVPNDVRIVERKEYEAIQRERGLGGNTGGLSAVNLLISGSVLEAKVDATEQKGKKTIRATVGKEQIPNQAYIKWLELPAKERKSIEKPQETRAVDRVENIAVNVTNHRKVGIFSVSFRLVDAENGRVLFPDSITKEDKYTDTSREGVEMGDFVLPFELADLPSDVKILDKLANEVSDEIGTRLVEKLRDQEKKYLAEADEFAKDSSCLQEADSLAKALVIMDAKGIDGSAVFDRYKDIVVNCGE